MDQKELAIRIDRIWAHALNARNSAQTALEELTELKQRIREASILALQAKLRHHKGRAS